MHYIRCLEKCHLLCEGWNKWVGVISKILDFCQNDLFWPIKGGRDHFETGILQKYSTRLPHIVYDPSLIAKTINRIRLDKRDFDFN